MSRRGFTLVELIVTIVIISILATLATLNFNQWVRKSNTEKEVKGLYADLLYVRQQAMVTGMTHRIHFTSMTDIIFLRYSSEGDATGTHIRQRSLPYAISQSSPAFTDIDFNSRGMMTDQTTKALCVYSDTGATVDSIVMMQSKFNLGRLQNQGSACNASNIDIQ